MKVQPDRSLDPTQFQRVESETVKTSQSRRSGGPSGPVTDSVAISSDVQLANTAAAAAAASPDVRPDQVARARALLDQGQVGSDLEALASRIIDTLVKP